jgi:hypothetical protein
MRITFTILLLNSQIFAAIIPPKILIPSGSLSDNVAGSLSHLNNDIPDHFPMDLEISSNDIPDTIVFDDVPDDISDISNIWTGKKNKPRITTVPIQAELVDLMQSLITLRNLNHKTPFTSDLNYMKFLKKYKIGGNDGNDASHIVARSIKEKSDAFWEASRQAIAAKTKEDWMLWSEIQKEIMQEMRHTMPSIWRNSDLNPRPKILNRQETLAFEKELYESHLKNLKSYLSSRQESVPISHSLDWMLIYRLTWGLGSDASATIAKYIPNKGAALIEANYRASKAINGLEDIWNAIANDIRNAK